MKRITNKLANMRAVLLDLRNGRKLLNGTTLRWEDKKRSPSLNNNVRSTLFQTGLIAITYRPNPKTPTSFTDEFIPDGYVIITDLGRAYLTAHKL